MSARVVEGTGSVFFILVLFGLNNCYRWCHGKCESLMTEELLDTAAERGFRCVYCRPPGSHCLQVAFGASVDESGTSSLDGVVLTKSGLDLANPRLPPPAVPIQAVLKKNLGDTRSRGAMSGAARAIEDTIDAVTAAVAKTFTTQSSEGILFSLFRERI